LKKNSMKTGINGGALDRGLSIERKVKKRALRGLKSVVTQSAGGTNSTVRKKER